jgi:aldose 1-epimerase
VSSDAPGEGAASRTETLAHAAGLIGPSGAQFELTMADQRAVVVEVGGGLRSYSASGSERLDGYPADEMCRSGRGQVLVPWPNRIQDGRYTFDGRDYQLALTEPTHGNAIHGLVRWAAWSIAAQEPARVVLEHVLHPQPGYPFTLAVQIEYALSHSGLSVRTTATNVGRDPCPYGAGAHPYLTVGTETVDSVALQAPGGTALKSDERGIPTGRLAVDGTDYDFRRGRGLGPTRLDHCFTDLERGDDGLARVVLRDPERASGLTLWVDDAYQYLMLFTGDPLPDVARRSLAVEPMTCPPNAFRTGEAVIRLEPGNSFISAWGLTPQTGP